MRPRIAQGAVRSSDASVHKSKRTNTDRPRRWWGSRLVTTMFVGGGALIAASVIAAATLGTAAGATHRGAEHHQRHARAEVGAPVAARAVRERVAIGMRWLTVWKSAHPSVHPAPPTPAPAPAPPPPVTDATSTTTPDWACIRLHESGDRFNTPAAPGGAYGFLEGTWLSLGYTGWPYQAPPAVQDKAVLYLYNELGWQPWSTRFVCGL